MKAKAMALLALLQVLAYGACDNTPAEPGSQIDPADFVPVIDNAYFPLQPGVTYSYSAETADGTETGELFVTNDTKVILGVTTTVVRDRVFLDGELIEETFDWYAQDRDGNVWYLGEDAKEYEGGQVVSTQGSWEAGVDGAVPGIIMQANPTVGQEYSQETAPGVAEDMARVLSLDASVSVPYGSFTGCLQTEDFTPLEPGVLAHKFYCAGVGLVLEVAVTDGGVRNELLAVTTP